MDIMEWKILLRVSKSSIVYLQSTMFQFYLQNTMFLTNFYDVLYNGISRFLKYLLTTFPKTKIYTLKYRFVLIYPTGIETLLVPVRCDSLSAE